MTVVVSGWLDVAVVVVVVLRVVISLGVVKRAGLAFVRTVGGVVVVVVVVVVVAVVVVVVVVVEVVIVGVVVVGRLVEVVDAGLDGANLNEG